MIIGLMSAALIGVAGMQLKWVLDTLEVNEAQFDIRVFDALNKVSEKLEYQESIEVMQNVDNGWLRQYYKEELKVQQESSLGIDYAPGHSESDGLVHLSKKRYLELVLSNPCNCSECTREREENFAKWAKMTEEQDLAPLHERIQLKKVDTYLRQEFQDMGIKTPFRYGVYDNKKKSFVLADGRWAVEDKREQTTLSGYQNLHTSDYKVSLFQGDVESPGMLMVYFPMKNTFIWSTVIKTLIGSIIFMSIILFCFAYTISVIFRQKKLSEMKNDFINNMTHEFKTPIATISLASDSIASPRVINEPNKIKRFTDIIRQENKRMNQQVEKVLQMARIDRQDFTLNVSEVNMHEVIQNAVEYISLQVEKKDGRVTTDLQADRPILKGDMTHISSMINNLLDNANKYSPEKPEISVTTRNVNGGLEVIVSDKGIGISKESKKHIFEKFYRVHTGNLHDVKGFGLGLSYVKAMVDAHKGKIDVKSDLGKGSSFILFFPNEN